MFKVVWKVTVLFRLLISLYVKCFVYFSICSFRKFLSDLCYFVDFFLVILHPQSAESDEVYSPSRHTWLIRLKPFLSSTLTKRFCLRFKIFLNILDTVHDMCESRSARVYKKRTRVLRSIFWFPRILWCWAELTQT